MSAKQSFVWTCLPNGVTADGRGLLVSVLLSPRLNADKDAPVLATFREWLDWPATLNGAVFTFSADGEPVTRHRVGAGAAGHSTAIGGPDSAVWRALFHKDVWVEAYRLNKDVLQSDIVSYSATDVHDMVRDLYQDLGTRTSDALPRLGADLLHNPIWKRAIAAVAEVDLWGVARIDRASSSQPAGRLPLRAGVTQIERRFAGLRDLAAARAGTAKGSHPATVMHLARFELFHTPPLPPKEVTPRERDDDPRIEAATQEFERTEMPAKTALAKDLDFHRIVAAMNSYSVLQRRLGLVLDFVIDRSVLPRKLDVLLRVDVEFRAGALVTGREPDVHSVTHVSHDSGFFAAAKPLAPTALDTRITAGLLDLYSKPERYATLQADVDGAGLKLVAFARTLGAYEQAEKKDPAAVSDDVSRKDKEAGAPALRTAGMMLVQKDRALALKARFDANLTQAHDAGSGTTELWAEDVTRGYRIDVWDAHVKRWRSLCRRTADYLLSGGALVVTHPSGEEETTVQLAATRSPDKKQNYNPKVLYLHEAMVSWTGWSLAVAPPGRAIADDHNTSVGGKPVFSDEAEMPPGLDFRSRFEVVKHSLPRLRYGRHYAMRARAVDLAGNSLPASENDLGVEHPELSAQPFLRFEPLLAPVITLVRPAGGTTEAPREGESMCRLAIRSFNDDFDDTTATTEVARRYAVPPQSTARDAELHGMLDAGGIVDSGTFQMLANERDRDARDPAASLVEETIALQGPMDATAVDTTFAVWREGNTMTYLPDPLAICVTACFIDHATISQDESLKIPLYPDGSQWPEAQPFQIELYEDAAAKPTFDATSRTLRVPLDKGDRATLRLSMRLSEDVLPHMGMWHWLKTAATPPSKQEALDGRHWMLTPWQDVELVHAVQRPLLRPELEKLDTDREYVGSTAARPHFDAVCSLKSTDRLDLLARWHEPQDDPTAAAPQDRERRDLAFHVKVTDERDYKPGSDAIPDHSPPDTGDPNRITVNSRRLDMVARKRHEFNDTRYRRIQYQLRATTRYREYLPSALQVGKDPATGKPALIDRHLIVDGPQAVTWVCNSAPPPAPQVLSVVPTFGWTRTRAEDGSAKSWRRGGGLRVYLDRPWNVTGYGEMLAVVLPPANFSGDPDITPGEHPYKKYVTQWGNDPIRESPYVKGLAPTRGDFSLARWQPDATGAWVRPDAPATERDQPPGIFRVVALSPPGRDASGAVDIAPHDVFFDDVRRHWYCDIEVAQGRSYWPFIRLALARYQPISHERAHLSDVVLADFMQLTADRWLTVTAEESRTVRHVTLYGPGYSDSAGAREAREILPQSRRDELTGVMIPVAPAPVAARPVVEVWLERLDAALGEDFGWSRIATGVASKSANDGNDSIPAFRAERIQPEQVVRGTQMLAARNYDDILVAGLVQTEAVTRPLWDGRVTLPREGAGDDRLRIVIAEYEEYPIDGEPEPADGTAPHSTTRTRTGRRLVFVEHVGLG